MKGVYVIRNLKTKWVYIGSSLIVETRVEEHFQSLREGKHGNYKLQAAFKTDGKHFVWEMLEEMEGDYIDREILYDREQYYLDSILEKYNILHDARGHLIKDRKKRLEHNKQARQRKLKL